MYLRYTYVEPVKINVQCYGNATHFNRVLNQTLSKVT